MRSAILHRYAGVFVALVLAPAILAQSAWRTIDDYQGNTNFYTTGLVIAAGGPSNLVVAVGRVADPAGAYGAVRCSRDEGTSWETVDVSPELAEVVAGSISPKGAVVLAGVKSTTPSPPHWLVRISLDQGTTWKTVEDYSLAPDGWCRPAAVECSLDGVIYVGGYGATNGGSSQWLVRRSADEGATWTTVGVTSFGTSTGPMSAMKLTSHGIICAGWMSKPNAAGDSIETWRVAESEDPFSEWRILENWRASGSDSCQPRGVATDGLGNWVVVGREGFDGGASANWVTRHSNDEGMHWAITDEPLQDGHLGYGVAVVADVGWRFFATGTDGKSWFTRVSGDGGSTWMESDRFDYATAATRPIGIAADQLGNIYVAGTGYVKGAKSHLVVRKLAARAQQVGPRLSCQRQGDTLLVTWPSSARGFDLEFMKILEPEVGWRSVGIPPVAVGEENVVPMDITGSQSLFRLHRP